MGREPPAVSAMGSVLTVIENPINGLLVRTEPITETAEGSRPIADTR